MKSKISKFAGLDMNTQDKIQVTTKLRPLGKITDDLEPLISELIDDHQLQWGEVLSLIHGYLIIHYPGAQEEYLDKTNPKFYYGPELDK